MVQITFIYLAPTPHIAGTILHVFMSDTDGSKSLPSILTLGKRRAPRPARVGTQRGYIYCMHTFGLQVHVFMVYRTRQALHVSHGRELCGLAEGVCWTAAAAAATYSSHGLWTVAYRKQPIAAVHGAVSMYSKHSYLADAEHVHSGSCLCSGRKQRTRDTKFAGRTPA